MAALTVVFDLDGTLVDTAPDLIKALNVAFAHEGLPRVGYAEGRSCRWQTLLGYFGGEAFKESLWKPLLTALGVAALVAGLGELWRRRSERAPQEAG